MVLTFRFEPGEGYIVETDPDNEVLSPKSGGKVKFIPRWYNHIKYCTKLYISNEVWNIIFTNSTIVQ